MKFKNKQNYGDRGQNSGYLGGGRVLTEKEHKGAFWVREMKFPLLLVVFTQICKHSLKVYICYISTKK